MRGVIPAPCPDLRTKRRGFIAPGESGCRGARRASTATDQIHKLGICPASLLPSAARRPYRSSESVDISGAEHQCSGSRQGSLISSHLLVPEWIGLKVRGAGLDSVEDEQPSSLIRCCGSPSTLATSGLLSFLLATLLTTRP